jgi:fructokinase
VRVERGVTDSAGGRTLVIGEVLWDLYPDAARLGGAPLNFAAHLKRLGHAPVLVSAVGADALGRDTLTAIESLGLDTAFVQSALDLPTGRAHVQVGPDEDTSFTILRPAAYDAVDLSHTQTQELVRWNPAWVYFGTVFPSVPTSRRLLSRLLAALPDAARFYDVNLRHGFEAPELVEDLLRTADVVKLNEHELRFVHERFDLPGDPESFCREGARRYDWQAACVTFGGAGCALLAGGEYETAPACAVSVADPVGAGDAFAAALLHGLAAHWPAAAIARFANRVGGLVAGRSGAIPDWAPEELIHG